MVASESRQSVEGQVTDVDEQQQQVTAASNRTARQRGHPALASESKQSVESQVADVNKQQQQAADRTDGEDIRQRI